MSGVPPQEPPTHSPDPRPKGSPAPAGGAAGILCTNALTRWVISVKSSHQQGAAASLSLLPNE